jgi:hypothetical protein
MKYSKRQTVQRRQAGARLPSQQEEQNVPSDLPVVKSGKGGRGEADRRVCSEGWGTGLLPGAAKRGVDL